MLELRMQTCPGSSEPLSHNEIMSVDSLISIEPVHAHHMHALIQNILSEDRNATKNGPPSAHQRNAFETAFCWRVNGPPLNAGLVPGTPSFL